MHRVDQERQAAEVEAARQRTEVELERRQKEAERREKARKEEEMRPEFRKQEEDYWFEGEYPPKESPSIKECLDQAKSSPALDQVWVGECDSPETPNIIASLQHLRQLHLGQYDG